MNGPLLRPARPRALPRVFRGKMRARFAALGLDGLIDPAVWTEEWVVHCMPVGSGRGVLKYLGAYVFRVAISGARILDYDRRQVRFKYRKSGSSRSRTMTLPVLEFIRRYLQHVLPASFTKVRHYGFLSPNFSVGLQRIREMICVLYETLRQQLPPARALPSEPLPYRRVTRLLAAPVRSPKGEGGNQGLVADRFAIGTNP